MLILILFMVKSFRPRESIGTLWRDGRAAEGACLENMFGSHQRGFESHSLRQNKYLVVTTLVVHKERLKSLQRNNLGRCQSGRMGPPAKRLPGRNPRSQVRILSSPPLYETRSVRDAFLFGRTPPSGDGIESFLPATL